MKLIPLGVWGGYPAANGATSSFLLEENGFRCLIDCGSGVLSSLQNYTTLGELDAVVISHYHADHVADIGPLQFGRMIQKQTGGTAAILPVYGHRHDAEGFEALTFKDITKGFEIDESESVAIGPWNVSFCQTTHPVYCLAIRFSAGGKSVVFTADTEWRDELVEFSREADLIVSEANLYEKHVGVIGGHMSGRQAGELAARAGAGRLLLTHLPQFGDLKEIEKDAQIAFGRQAELAKVGKTYDI